MTQSLSKSDSNYDAYRLQDELDCYVRRADMAAQSPGVDLAALNAATRGRLASAGKALPGGRFPIRNASDLEKAVRMVGLAKGDHADVRRFIHRRATALGLTHKVPSGWKPDGSLTIRSRLTRRGQK